MKNKIIAIALIVGIWIPMIMLTIEELSGGFVKFGFTENMLFVAGICIFSAIPFAAIQLLKK